MFDFIGDIIGGLMGQEEAEDNRNATREANAQNAALQREFAQNGLQWKVEDARKAGINPVYALGAQSNPAMASFMPAVADSGIGDAISRAGSSLQRASEAGQTAMQRLQERLLTVQIEGQEIENARRASQLALTTGAQRNPPFPDAAGSSTVPITAKGTHIDYGALPSPEIAEIMESDPISWIALQGINGVNNARYAWRDFKSWWSRLGNSSNRDYFPEGR